MRRTSREWPGRLYLSQAALAGARLPTQLLASANRVNTQALSSPLAVVCASEILIPGRKPPDWTRGPETRYLVLIDVPDPALVRLPRLLSVHRPDYRLYLSRDTGAVRRLLIGLLREQPVLGMVDAYPLGTDLYVLTADFELRCFPFSKIPVLAHLRPDQRREFSVDEDGSYLHWPQADLHLGVSQLLQEVDPAYMADVAIKRNERDKIGAALRLLREERSFTQSDILGISVRQVSRIESGVSRLRYDAIQKFAKSFGMEPGALLTELGRRASELRTAAAGSRHRSGSQVKNQPTGRKA